MAWLCKSAAELLFCSRFVELKVGCSIPRKGCSRDVPLESSCPCDCGCDPWGHEITWVGMFALLIQDGLLPLNAEKHKHSHAPCCCLSFASLLCELA